MKLSNEKIMQFLHKTDDAELFAEADRIRREVYGDEVYLRGLIEFTNYCAQLLLLRHPRGQYQTRTVPFRSEDDSGLLPCRI